MADYITSEGREIEFDLSKMTLREFRSLFDTAQPQIEEDEIIARVSGLTVEEYRDLPYPDWRALVREFFAACQKRTGVPNSGGESIST